MFIVLCSGSCRRLVIFTNECGSHSTCSHGCVLEDTLCDTGLIIEGMCEDREEVLQRVTQDEALGKINHRSMDLLQQF